MDGVGGIADTVISTKMKLLPPLLIYYSLISHSAAQGYPGTLFSPPARRRSVLHGHVRGDAIPCHLSCMQHVRGQVQLLHAPFKVQASNRFTQRLDLNCYLAYELSHINNFEMLQWRTQQQSQATTNREKMKHIDFLQIYCVSQKQYNNSDQCVSQ